MLQRGREKNGDFEHGNGLVYDNQAEEKTQRVLAPFHSTFGHV